MKEASRLCRVFQNLDRWRHLPAYQLERRADAFFSPYLKGLLEDFTRDRLMDIIIPELPIKDEHSHRSAKVDYALFSEDRTVAYLVELKTDLGSRRESQDLYLERAKQMGFRSILEGL